MTIGDLLELLQEKLRTGEFSRMDTATVAGYSIQSVNKTGGWEVSLSSESLMEDLREVEDF